MNSIHFPALDRAEKKRNSLWSPPEDLTVSEFADLYRVLSSEGSAEPGQWETDRVPYSREILDTFINPDVSKIIFKSSSQVSKTEIMLTLISYAISEDPGPILFVMPHLDLAKSFSKERFDPMIRDTPRMDGKINIAKTRDGGNEIYHKLFLGGYIKFSGANSPASLAYRPARYVFADEVDKMGIRGGLTGKEVIAKLHKRTTTFWNSKEVYVSTPEEEGSSAIDEEYANSDARIFKVPCLKCNVYLQIKFDEHIKWEKDRPETAHFECPSCKQKTFEDDLPAMNALGYWEGQKPFKGVAGFFINEVNSPWVKWTAMAAAFLHAKKDDKTLKVFINESLGQTWKTKGEAPPWENLYDRAESYAIGTVPQGGILLVAGADVQKDRAEIEIVAYGKDLESWSVEYIVIQEPPTGTKLWEELADLVNRTWKHESGVEMSLQCLAIDANYSQTEVCNWARKYSSRTVMAIYGSAKALLPVNRPTKVDLTIGGKKLEQACNLWPLGVNKLKAELYRWLNLDSPKDGSSTLPGYCHFPKYPSSYFQMLTAEELKTIMVKGYPKTEWNLIRPRNEALDCRNYARAAGYRLGMDRWSADRWVELADALGIPKESEKI